MAFIMLMPKSRKGADANGNQRTSGTYYSRKHNIKKGNVAMEAFIAAGASITVGGCRWLGLSLPMQIVTVRLSSS